MIAHAIVKCEGGEHHDNCPYIATCLARLTDRTITGCGMPLFLDGLIPKSEIVVEHTVGKGDK